MGYLETISLLDDVELYIIGDLIDRGHDSYRILYDIKNRIEKNNRIKIHYLAGDHELIMYQALKEKKPGESVSVWSDWLLEGGGMIDGIIDSLPNADQDYEELKQFLSKLKIFQVLDEKINNKNIVLVHAKCPDNIEKELRLKEDNKEIFNILYTRKKDFLGRNHKLGKEGYFTIIGHTPNKEGFSIVEENVLGIDGGCGPYAMGHFEYQHVPLVEVKEDSLNILLFNHNNEITQGYSYNGNLKKIEEQKLNKERMLLIHRYDNQEEYYKDKILEYKKILKM